MRIRIVDAFSDRPFAGNPAAVCLLDGGTWPDEAWMRSVAAEVNLSETAFAHPLPGGDGWALRWFTPTVEANMCGHATLATAHAMREDRGGPGTVRFTSMAGELVTHAHEDGSITLDFPVSRPTAAAVPDGLAEALGAQPISVYETGFLGDLLIVLDDEAIVRKLDPDISALTRLSADGGPRSFLPTALAAEPDCGYDFVSRLFAPACGIPEDPVTGSAHTALAPYWAERLGRATLTGLQVSARSGVVRVEVAGDRVLLTGRAVTVLDGVLRVGPPR